MFFIETYSLCFIEKILPMTLYKTPPISKESDLDYKYTINGYLLFKIKTKK